MGRDFGSEADGEADLRVEFAMFYRRAGGKSGISCRFEGGQVTSMNKKYVHGYTARECARLVDQATTLADVLHSDTVYPAGSNVLEAGCGVGAQTIILARNSPNAKFTAVDVSKESLRAAKVRVFSKGFTNVTFHQSDIFQLPYDDNSFDHLFLCFVLEHLPNPIEALLCLRRVLKRGGTITVIEGDHGSTYFHPESPGARKTIQ
jgi:ubiquinone/menaquinone biosynthesis C-methylase UbiE